MKKFVKIIAYSLGGLLVFVLLLAAFTQTQLFRDYLRSTAMSSLDSLLDAEIQLGEIQGNLVEGFSIDHLSIKVRKDYLLVADRLDLRYDLFQIPGNVISVDRITLVRPSVKFLRGRDGVWNLDRMLRPTPEDTMVGGRFDWTILVDRLEIQDGTITLVDSAALASADHSLPDSDYVEYHDFKIQRFNLITSALIKDDEKHAVISSLSFLSDRPTIDVRQLTGDFHVTPTVVRVKDMVIETSRSSLNLDVAVNDIDLLGGPGLEQLKSSPIEVSVRGNNVDLRELKKFIPDIDFLDGVLSLDLVADGGFGEIGLRKLDIRTGQTELHFSGWVYNLDKPRDLFLDLKLTESKLYSPDARMILPTLNLPDYRSLGVTTLNLEFLGRPADFQTKFLLETSAGNLHSDLNLKIAGAANLAYKGAITLQNLDIATVLKNERLTSRLNSLIRVEGSGTSFDGMVASLEVDVDSSEFLGQKLQGTRLLANVSKGKIEGTIDIGLGSMRSTLTAMLQNQHISQPSFEIKGEVRSLHLEDLFQDKSLDSDISFAINAAGTELTWDKLNGDFQIGFSSSRYRDYHISSGDVHLSLDQHNPLEKTLILESNIADFSLTGAFDIEYLRKLIEFEFQNMRVAIGEKFAVIGSTLEKNVDRQELELIGRSLSSADKLLDVDYSLHLKDLEPISIITENRTFNGVGKLSGSIKGNYENLSLQVKLEADEFFYGNVESGVLVENALATLDVEGLKPLKPLRDVGILFAIDAGRMHISNSEFDSLKVSLTYQQGSSSYAAQATFDRDIRFVVQGLANVTDDQVVFSLSDLRVAHQDFAWRADGGATISFGSEDVHVKDLTMRWGTQVVKIDGSVGSEEVLAGSLAANKLELDDLKYFLSEEELRPKHSAFSGLVDFNLTASGTLEQPEYSASLRADGVMFRNIVFGDVKGDFSYRNRVLETDVQVENHRSDSDGSPELTISGTLPINLGITNVNERWPDIPMELFVRSKGVQLNFLDPLLPTFNDLRGVMMCNIEIRGSPKSPDYRGEMRIDSCYFLFVPNNIYYTLEATLAPDGERIKVVHAAIRNVPSDERSGQQGLMDVKGDFALREFSPSDFDLVATGQLLVVKLETRKSQLSVYGNLFVEIGASGLHFTGSPSQSLLKGDIQIRNSRLIFPPTHATVTEESEFAIPIVVVDDTSKIASTDTRSSAARYFQSQNGGAFRTASLTSSEVVTKSFLDGMQYDLNIETSGSDTEIRMIFSNAPVEELQANIRGKFSIIGNRERWTGDLEVVRAFYYFYKQFDAEGTITYTGDFLDPELDIKAKYEGTRVLKDTLAENKTEKIVVNLHITGTRKEPHLEISMTIDDVDYYSYAGQTSSDVQSDAIAFILAGTFPLSKSQANDVASDVGSTFGLSLVKGASSLLTSELSEFLRRETGFITSFELSHGSRGTDVRVSGTVFKGLWRIGGIVQDDPFNNANVSLLYSFGDIFNTPSLRNFMFELDRKVEVGTIGLTNDKKEVNSARLFYRFSF